MKRLVLPGAAVLVAVLALIVVDSPEERTAEAAPSAGRVERGALSAVVSQAGTLTYRARPDGSPYAVVGRATGTYTDLPEVGDEVGCGGVAYRVDTRPVLLLCGATPAYRALRLGDRGPDVRELNRGLRLRGERFTPRTRAALRRARGSGVLALGDAVVAPEAVRISGLDAVLGASARPGARVLEATSRVLHVQTDLDPSEQGQVELGDRTTVTLPGGARVPGRVVGFGRIAEAPAEPGAGPAEATVPTSISLDDPDAARGLDRAPVQVDITTDGVAAVLSVPVTALVGRAGGGLAVEVVRGGGRRALVAVEVGLFDTARGRVQVDGVLRAGERVVVPAP